MKDCLSTQCCARTYVKILRDVRILDRCRDFRQMSGSEQMSGSLTDISLFKEGTKGGKYCVCKRSVQLQLRFPSDS